MLYCCPDSMPAAYLVTGKQFTAQHLKQQSTVDAVDNTQDTAALLHP